MVLAVLIGTALHFLPGSVFSSPALMDAYFGYENSPGSWTWEHQGVGSWSKHSEPFKYRIVFRELVDGLAHLFLLFGAKQTLTAYWLAYLSISVLAQVFAFWSCDRLLQALGARITARVLGLIAWIILPPIAFAFILPVQTKEDFIAYGLMFLAVRAMLLEDWKSVIFICVLGTLVRETLLIISGLVVIGTNAPKRTKWIAIALPVAIHILLRTTLGMSGYQVFRDSNLKSVGLLIVSAFFTFGYSWVLLVPYILQARISEALGRGLCILSPSQRPLSTTIEVRLSALQSAFPILLFILLMAHFFMGRIQEIRITCLLSPFVVLAAYQTFGERSLTLRNLRTPFFAAAAVFMGIFGLEVAGLMSELRVIVNTSMAEFAHPTWWLMLYVQLALGVGVCVASFASQNRR